CERIAKVDLDVYEVRLRGVTLVCLDAGERSSEEHQNEKTSSPPPRKKSLSPPQAPSKSISSKSTHYTSSSSPSSELGSELTSLIGSELGSELTSLAASCQVSSSELREATYRLIEDTFLATCEQELCAFGFLLASFQISSSELHATTYSKSNDIQAAGSDTRPPMLNGIDYDSWSQRIQLYCWGKENGIYILQSIDHGPFELRTTKDTLGTTPEGGVLLGPERPCTYDDHNDNEKKRFDANVCATNIMLQGLPKDIYKLINHNIKAKSI
nr:integrase, catalytic region, zinc finger, CCHC-type, peptidase aspartic, catalytic [Tanacetum cinerariifolium]